MQPLPRPRTSHTHPPAAEQLWAAHGLFPEIVSPRGASESQGSAPQEVPPNNTSGVGGESPLCPRACPGLEVHATAPRMPRSCESRESKTETCRCNCRAGGRKPACHEAVKLMATTGVAEGAVAGMRQSACRVSWAPVGHQQGPLRRERWRGGSSQTITSTLAGGRAL